MSREGDKRKVLCIRANCQEYPTPDDNSYWYFPVTGHVGHQLVIGIKRIKFQRLSHISWKIYDSLCAELSNIMTMTLI